MKTPKSSKNTLKSGKKTSTSHQTIQPTPLKIVHPSPLLKAAPSPSPSQETTDNIRPKRKSFTPKSESSTQTAKRLKQVDPNCAEEIAKEMSVGFGVDKFWYDSY